MVKERKVKITLTQLTLLTTLTLLQYCIANIG